MTERPYRSAVGTSAGSPPFHFQGVTMWIFPLRADRATLQRLCDRVLNIVPPEIAVFRAPLPMVNLAMITYDRMQSVAQAGSLGWVAQNELYFGVPVERHRKVGDQLVREGWGLYSPYIFVDERQSVLTGREVYGWRKELVSFAPEPTDWLRPDRPTNRITVRSPLYPRGYAGGLKAQQDRVLLQVDQHPPPSFLTTPPTVDTVVKGWFDWPSALATPVAWMQDWVRGMAAGGSFDPSERAHRMADLAEQARRGSISYQTINLKQFRDHEEPGLASYQELTDAPMRITAFHRGGLLGEQSVLRGDLSGGYRILLHDYAAQPIMDTLGLQEEHESIDEDYLDALSRGITHGTLGQTWLDQPEGTKRDRERDSSHRVAVLRPMYSAWMHVDIQYGLGNTICSRTKETDWRTPDAPEEPATTPAGYISLGGNVAAAARGVNYEIPGATMRVLPLLADPDRLAAFVDRYLNFASDVPFHVLGRYVYFILCTPEEVVSDRSGVGRYAEYELDIAIPICWFNGNVLRAGIFTPYVFQDCQANASMLREVDGLPAMQANFTCPPDVWMTDRGPVVDQPLLRLHVGVLPTLNVDVEGVDRVILEVIHGDPKSPIEPELKDGARAWERIEAEEEQRIAAAAKILATDPEAQERAREAWAKIDLINVKQFPSTSTPDQACYQRIVHLGRRLSYLHPIEGWDLGLAPLRQPLHLRIHRQPSHPIVEELGLVVMHEETRKCVLPGRAWEGAPVDVLKPLDPFWFKAAFVHDTGARDLGDDRPRPLIGLLKTAPAQPEPQAIFRHALDLAAGGGPKAS